jgi:DEAD/DEAH box helicase/Helicase conserved C-terminal domain
MANLTIESAKNHNVFRDVLNAMITNRFYSELEIEGIKEDIKKEKLDEAIWLASIIASSPEENDKYLSSVFGIALFLEKTSKEYRKAAYIILSRSGNLIASRFFKELIKINAIYGSLFFNENFGTIIDYELGSKLALNEIESGDGKIIGSDYQKYLWNVLTKKDDNIAISAPTSAGKSFIIQNYIRQTFIKKEKFFIVYIVPTRALISQVSEDFKRELKSDVSINTAFIEQENPETKQFTDKELFILTPERTMKLMQYSYDNDFVPDLIFIDEVQNIEDDGNRGFLFEYLINEIETNWVKSRKIIAGPFLDKPNVLLGLLFGEESKNLKTMFSPVFQLKVSLKPTPDNDLILAKIFFQQKLINEIKLPIEFNYSKEISKSKLKTTVKVVLRFGRNSKNIIYFPKTNYVEQFSNYLTHEINASDVNIELDDEIKELIELIKEEIHPDYYLVDALKTKTAFHHGKLPEIIRGELEYLFSKGALNNIICTSTLMEGINLPAEKVFIPYPKKDRFDLSPFEFGNIVGRAGRIRDALTGTIICMEKSDEYWAEEFYQNEPDKEITPAINKILHYPVDDLIHAINQPLDEKNKDIEFGVIFLKNKFLRGDNLLIEYLYSKGIDESLTHVIVDSLSKRLNKISIPKELLRLNPSIDPELQDKLYKRIKKEGINKWVLHKNENFNAKWKKDVIKSKPHENTNFFGQLGNILFKLDEIFDFNAEAYFKHQISRTLPQMVFYAVLWMENKSFNELITKEINFKADILKTIDRESKVDVNKTINEIIKVYSTIVSYVLVKYTKLLADILEAILTEEELEKHKLSISLPTMLELGTYNSLVLLLISKGMSRSIAIKVYKLIPEEEEETPIEWLSKQNKLKINEIYNKYLLRKGFLLKEDKD